MRLLAITPIHVTEPERARRADRYGRLAPAPLRVEVRNLPPDAPTSLETEEDVRRSEAFVAEAIRHVSVRDGDAVLPDCVLDPAVEELSGRAAVPVLGMLRLAAGFLASTGRPFAAVARNKAIADELHARLRVYGVGAAVTGVEVLDLDFEAVSAGPLWEQGLVQAVAGLASSGASSVINGCSAVDVRTDTHPVPVVDPAALALHLLAGARAAGALTDPSVGRGR